MKREQYDEYLRCFNARDYEGLFEFFDDEFEVSFAGYHFTRKQDVLDFYAFLHAHLDEQITIHRYVSDDDTIAMEATVRLEGIAEMTTEMLRERGLERIVPIKVGQVIEIPQFIHYHLRNGKFQRALCAVC